MNTKKILALVCVGFGLAGIGSKAANACDLYCACDVKWTKSGTVEKNMRAGAALMTTANAAMSFLAVTQAMVLARLSLAGR